MDNTNREKLVVFLMYAAFVTIISRLFYWQIIKGESLQAAAENQYERTITQTGSRGTIYTADGYILVSNKPVYRLFAQPAQLEIPPESVVNQIVPLLLPEYKEYKDASTSAALEELSTKIKEDFNSKLSKKDSQWVSLKTEISEPTKEQIESLKIHGLGFDQYQKRDYPEASMAAHLTGFVGKDESGNDLGYFGLEGALEKELQARSSTNTVITDALGGLLVGNPASVSYVDGRNVTTSIRRDVQYAVEQSLKVGIEKYGAAAGEAIVMEPATGKILALAAYPNYDQSAFIDFSPDLYKNPSIANLYEPGSTFKILTVAAGIDTGKITAETTCPRCSSPRVFGQYTIRTWNDVYNPNISMIDALAKSDNTAMIYVAELLGADTFQKYIKAFGIGEPLHLELQEDTATPFPDQWNPVRLATASFGQGILTNSLQMLRAVSTIANDGVMMKPIIVTEVSDPTTGETITTPVREERRVVSAATAQEVTRMMIHAAQSGEAQWTASRTHTIAGKTGTSQVAIAGGYAEDKTVASFIGFAPPDNPKFVLLVKLTEPTSSPWAAETAAPLWYHIAERLYLLLNIPPDRIQSSSSSPEQTEN
jgi:cell division protein FtsI (penicillin-binding protein 3)